MMSKENFEKAWKVFTVILGVVIVPLAGWVWNTNVALAQIQNDLTDAEDTILILERKVEEAEANSRAIISIEKDIEYMKKALERIEALVAVQ
jgi:cell division protein FtsL